MLNDPVQRDSIKLRFDRYTRRIKRRILKIERQLDDLVSDVQTMEDESHVMLEGIPTSEDTKKSPPTPRGDHGPSGNCSEARSLVIRRRPDKFFDVFIDFAEKPLVLQQQMGLFLECIAGGKPGGPGGLIAYQTEDDMRAFLTKINSRTKDPHKYIANLVNDLKKELEKAAFSRDLVQRNSHGVRFAWRGHPPSSHGRHPLVFRT